MPDNPRPSIPAGEDPDLLDAMERLYAETEHLRLENEQLLESQHALEEQRDFYSAIYEDTPIGCLVMDEHGMIRTLNEAAARILDVPRERALGRSMKQFVVDSDRVGLIRHLAHCQRRQPGPMVTELGIMHGERAAVPVELWTARGAPQDTLYPSAIVDITARRAADGERRSLRDAERTARAESEAKDHFIATLSHELRTPLTPVLAAVSALVARDQVPAPMRPILEMIRRNVAAEARLIDDLLDAARIRRGKLSVRRQPMDMHDAALQALDVWEEQARRKRIAVEVALEAKQHHANADPLRMRQVFWNLLGNALKFTPDGGKVAVRSWNHSSMLAIEVSDTGIGVRPEMLNRLFRPFEQGPDGLPAGGLGLGLAIAQGLMDLHGGRIQASSGGPGTGTRFVVEIETIRPPLRAEEAEPVTAVVAADHRRILLVEDHVDTATSLAELLVDEGYDVQTATSAASALAIDLDTIDVVVSDLGLPDRSGHDLMRELRQRRRLPAIALSGYGTEADKRASQEAGFTAHLTKPVDWPELLATIQRVR